MRRVHIAGLGFEMEVIMHPLGRYGCDRLYLVDEAPKEARAKYREAIFNPDLLRGIAPEVDIYRLDSPPSIESIYNVIDEIAESELESSSKVFINLSSGSRLFGAAAAVVASQRKVELYYVQRSSYHVERDFLKGIEQVVHLPSFLLRAQTVKVDSALCFVVMPFAEDLQAVFEEVIKPVAVELGLRCTRADDVFDNRPIMDDIWENIERARLIVADLTGRNPNVFYETGLAHAMGKEVVLLTQSLNDVPFDLRHLRCIVYSDSVKGTHKLTTDLRKTLGKVLERTRTEKATQ